MGVGNIVTGGHKTYFCFVRSFRNVHNLRYGLKSGPMRRASTGISPLLRLWLPSPQIAVKSLAVRGKKVHQSRRVATLHVVNFVNRESDTPAPPHWYASRTPHPTKCPARVDFGKRVQANGLCSPLRVSSEYCHASDPQPVAKVRLEPPNSESHAAEEIVEDAAPYHENPPQVPPVPWSILRLQPNVLPVALGISLPIAMLPIPLLSQGIPPKVQLV